MVTPAAWLSTACAAVLVAACAAFTGAELALRLAAYPADRSRSFSRSWVSVTTDAFSCARCWMRPFAVQVFTSP